MRSYRLRQRTSVYLCLLPRSTHGLLTLRACSGFSRNFYWKLLGYDQRFNIADRIEKRNGRPPRERVVQDVELPIDRTAEFLDWSWTTYRLSRSGYARCVCATTTNGRCIPSARAHLRQRRLLVVGAGRSQRPSEEGHTNKLIERAVTESCTDTSRCIPTRVCSPDEFDELYGGETYRTVKVGGLFRSQIGRDSRWLAAEFDDEEDPLAWLMPTMSGGSR